MADASTHNPAPAETDVEPIIRCRNVTKKFGPQTVLDELTLDVKRGERLVILGGSGAGKSTLLGMMSAQTLPTSGQILINGKDLCAMSAAQLDKHRTTTGVLFQSGALFQSMSLACTSALRPGMEEKGTERPVPPASSRRT